VPKLADIVSLVEVGSATFGVSLLLNRATLSSVTVLVVIVWIGRVIVCGMTEAFDGVIVIVDAETVETVDVCVKVVSS
jgi:hypothetical protein